MLPPQAPEACASANSATPAYPMKFAGVSPAKNIITGQETKVNTFFGKISKISIPPEFSDQGMAFWRENSYSYYIKLKRGKEDGSIADRKIHSQETEREKSYAGTAGGADRGVE